MPENPVAHLLFWPVVARVAALLGAGLVLVLILERRRLREVARSPLFLRVRTWALIAPVFVICLFSGGALAFALPAYVGVQGSREYSRLVGLEPRYSRFLYLWVFVGLVVAAVGTRFFLLLPLAFFVLLILVPIVTGHVRGAHRQVTGTLFGYLLIGLPMAYLVLIKVAETWGLEFLLIVGVAVALSDVSAFLFGSLLKGPKLAPKVSPNKTWSGTAGNLIGAAAGVALLSLAIPDAWTGTGVVALVATLAVGAILGDLTESFIKRDFAAKDTGDVLPGFGGILDRVDSLLLAMPLGYYALLVANHFAG